MRALTVSRMALEPLCPRLDVEFHLRRQSVVMLLETADARHAPLEDLVASLEDGSRLPLTTTGIPLIRLSNLRACEMDLHNTGWVDPAAGSWPEVKAGDVLFARAAETFRAAVVPAWMSQPATVAPEITVIRSRPAFHPEVLAAILSTATFNRLLRDLAYQGHGGAMNRLRLSDVRRLPIPLPARGVQESIRAKYRLAEERTRLAQEELSSVLHGIHSEISYRIGEIKPVPQTLSLMRSQLKERWDVSYLRGNAFLERLKDSKTLRPLADVAQMVPATLKGVLENDRVLAIQADDINESTFLVEGASHRTAGDLSARMRQPLQIGDVLLCTTGAGNQVAFLDDALSEGHCPLLGSSTFTALRFADTPRFYAMALKHPIVRAQLDFLASGTVQRFVNKRELNVLRIPTLALTWREDFEVRLDRAFRRRREALVLLREVLTDAEALVSGGGL